MDIYRRFIDRTVGRTIKMEYKFAFYQLGDSVIATNAFAKVIGIETVQIEQPNKDTIAKGVANSPEFACFPFKLHLGLLFQAIDKGANVLVIPLTRSIVACQSSDFAIAQKYILRKLEKPVDVILIDTMNPADITKKFQKYKSDITLKQITKGILFAGQKLVLIEKVEEYYRNIYLTSKKKKAEIFRTKWYKRIDSTNTIMGLYTLNGKIKSDYEKYPPIKQGVLKIAVIGDIYTMNEPFMNNNIFERLSDLGVYTEQGMVWSGAFGGVKIRGEDIVLSNQAKKYMRHNVGAYALDTVKDAIKYAEKGFDGLIHIYPFSCMPEITVRNILPKISSDYKIPILYLPIDEQTGDAGFTTRVEAFVDLIHIRKNKNNFSAIDNEE